MPSKRVLVLGGTSDARALAKVLMAAGHETVTSLAGVTRERIVPDGEVRVGGFGGEEGLHTYLINGKFAAIADATHPFAAQISQHGFGAARRAGIPYLRLEREAWVPAAGDRWANVPSVQGAAEALPNGARILLTIGRKEIAPFLARSDISGVARMIEDTQLPMPSNWRLILARPPFSIAEESRLLSMEQISHLVTKNAGSPQTEAKLEAARMLHLPTIMISRPAKPGKLVFNTPAALCVALGQFLLGAE